MAWPVPTDRFPSTTQDRRRRLTAGAAALALHAVFFGLVSLYRPAPPEPPPAHTLSCILLPPLQAEPADLSPPVTAESLRAPSPADAPDPVPAAAPVLPAGKESSRAGAPASAEVPASAAPPDSGGIPGSRSRNQKDQEGAIDRDEADVPPADSHPEKSEAPAESKTAGTGTEAPGAAEADSGDEAPNPAAPPLTGQSEAKSAPGPSPPDFEALARGLTLALPAYPAAARRFGYEGTVKVRIRIDAGGAVTGVTLLESSGFGILDRSVLQTISEKWHFNAPGQPVELRKNFTFRL